ncbi:MAG: alcohol dehydrogenase [Blastopirellula sp.]|nr:MAG: alcohol dehydrogenase [Blastopirellula sp.]
MLCQTSLVVADPWPQILGPNRDGISQEKNLISSWPAAGPKINWRVTGGIGMSGIVVDRGQVITMVESNQQQTVIALAAGSGKVVWQTPVAPAYKNAMGPGSRATPTIAGDQVFIFTGEGILAALDFESGKIQWIHNVVKDLKGKPAEYGMASSPLVIGNQVIVTAGAANGAVVAFDTKTGKQNWQTGNETTGYSSAAILNVNGEQQLVAFTGSALLGIQPTGGQLLWRYPYVTDYNCNIVTPISINGDVFISSGENHGCVLLSIQKQAGQYAVKEKWTSLTSRSVMRNEWQTSVLLDGYLYGMDNVGSAGPVTHLTCINAVTGERVWQQLRFGKSNLSAADGKLFISTMKGELVIVKASPDGYQELGRATVIETTRQAPVISNGQLYLRDNQKIVCIDLKK